MAKIIVNDDKFIIICSDWMGSTRYHIPVYNNRHVLI